MCTKPLQCWLKQGNESIISDFYIDDENKQNSKSAMDINEIKIVFKGKVKLLTGLDAMTIFNDLKLALLASFKQSVEIKQVELDKYVICESINSVEKVIDSSISVQSELKRLNQESYLLGDEYPIYHIMRLKSSIQKLATSNQRPVNNHKKRSDISKKESDKVAILEEFCQMSPASKIKTKRKIKQKHELRLSELDKALHKFDRFIEERETYIKLLEDYLKLLETIETEKESEDEEFKNDLNQITETISSNYCITDTDTDTGFSSSSNSSSTSSINKYFSNSSSNLIPNRIKFETYV